MSLLYPFYRSFGILVDMHYMIPVLLILLAYLRRWLPALKRRAQLPPGPSGNIIFGNTFPAVYTYRHFETLTQKYGPVFSLRQGLTTIVVIGRYEAAVEILEKQGAATADRPRNIASGEVLSGGLRTLFTPFGDKFRRMRRAFRNHLHQKVLFASPSLHMRNTARYILDIAEGPHDFQQHAIKLSASTLMSMAYEMKIDSYDHAAIRAMRRCLGRLAQSFRPGYWKVDTYAFLRYIPGYLKELQEGHEDEFKLFTGLFSDVRQRMNDSQSKGTDVPPSFARYLIENQTSFGFTDGEAAYMAGAMFGAGTDTTSATINCGIMAAALYPEMQARVYEELRRVVGHERLPTLDDMERGDLVWVRAWVLEVMRWRPVTALGFPHRAMRDIVWNGYVIPKGACIHGNIWSINRDPEYYPEPEKFDPSRWINEQGVIREDLRMFSFGFGRRVCPGQHLASGSLFLAFALLFWTFDIKEDPDYPIDEWAFTEGGNAHPKPFKVVFEQRIGSSVAEIQSLFENY